jgi:hypothetical protein
MSALKNFERLYKFNPFDFMKKLNADYFGEIKNRIFTTLVADVVKEEYDVKADETFFKLLVESYQEAEERFPQNQKIDYGEILLDLDVTPLNPNVPKSKGIIEDFKEIVSDDDLRPSMKGVYFDDGFMVGTDAHVLVKDYSPNEFTKKYNKKIIDAKVYIKSKGEVVKIIDEKYPEYDRVIPTSGFEHRINVNLYELFNISRSAAFYLKLVDANVLSLKLKIKGEKFAVNPILLADLTEYFLKKGSTTAELKYTAPNRAIVMDFGGSTGLLMPVVNFDDKDRNIIDTLTYDLQELDAFKGSGKPTGQRKPATRTAKPKESQSESKEEETRSQDFRKYTGKFAGENEYISRRDIEKIILKDKTILETNDFIDGVYRAKKKFNDGGSIAQGNYEMALSKAKEIQHHALELKDALKKEKDIEAWVVSKVERASSDLSDVTHYLDGKSEYGNGGMTDLFEDYESQEPKLSKIVKKINDAYDADKVNTAFLNRILKETEAIGYTFEIDMDGSAYGLRPKNVPLSDLKGFEEDDFGGAFKGGGVTKNLKRVVRKGTKYGKLAVKKAKPTAKRIVKKAKIGFKALANKVAKAYEGKAVKPKYQSEYGKRYSKAEAKEVGNKVAAKVKRLKGM